MIKKKKLIKKLIKLITTDYKKESAIRRTEEKLLGTGCRI